MIFRTADLIFMVLDATKQDIHKDLLERELESVGIRLNQRPPNIYFKPKTGGGLSFNSTCSLTYVDEKLVRTILHEYKVQSDYDLNVLKCALNCVVLEFKGIPH